jgi:hypothetical protein
MTKKTVEIESDGTVVIPCTCGDKNCTTFLHVKPNNDIDVVFYGKRQFTVGVPENIRLAIVEAAQSAPDDRRQTARATDPR